MWCRQLSLVLGVCSFFQCLSSECGRRWLAISVLCWCFPKLGQKPEHKFFFPWSLAANSVETWWRLVLLNVQNHCSSNTLVLKWAEGSGMGLSVFCVTFCRLGMEKSWDIWPWWGLPWASQSVKDLSEFSCNVACLARNLYFVSVGLGLVLERSVFCKNIWSGDTGTITSFFVRELKLVLTLCGTCWRPEHVWSSRVLVGMGLGKQAGTHSQLEAEWLLCLLFLGFWHLLSH